MAKPKVLMLGWHFSARISGGMGVASYHIAKSISEKNELTVILPSFDENQYPLKARIIDVSKIDRTTSELSSINHVHHFTSTESLIISPYQSSESHLTRTEEIRETILTPLQLIMEEYNNLIIELALKEEFEIIHCHDWMTFAAGIALKSMTGKKLIVHVHSLEYDRGHSDNWIFGLERKAMDMADAVICVSNYSKEIARKYYNIYSEKIRTIYNGVSKDDKIERTDKKSHHVVTYAGRLTEQKGIRTFIESALIIYSQLPEVQFVIAGDGPLTDEIKNMISLLPGKENFHFLGYLEQEELQLLFAGSDVLCMPSISEPFGLVALEAANQGVACVISKQAGVAEILISSLKAEPKDTDGFASSVVSLLENIELRENIIHLQASEIENFSWEKTASEILEVYEEVTK